VGDYWDGSAPSMSEARAQDWDQEMELVAGPGPKRLAPGVRL